MKTLLVKGTPIFVEDIIFPWTGYCPLCGSIDNSKVNGYSDYQQLHCRGCNEEYKATNHACGKAAYLILQLGSRG